MGPKWKEIAKLSKLEEDLAKLKHLSELPSLFKSAIAAFNTEEDVTVFSRALESYRDYSSVLVGYRSTKFLVALCGEIKSYVVRVK